MENNSFEICIAARENVAELAEMLGMLFSLEKEFIPDPGRQRAGLDMIVYNPAVGEIFIAKNKGDGSICGMVSLLYTVSTALGGEVALLEDMFVLPEFRRCGLGSMLVSEAVEHARQKGLLRISLLTDNDNHSAISFYKAMNFEESSMIVMRNLL